MRVMGIGFREKAELASFEQVYMKLSVIDFDHITVLARKERHAGLSAFIDKYGFSCLSISDDNIYGIQTKTYSEVIYMRFGTGSVSEALAIYSTQPSSSLLQARIISDDGLVTAALAERLGETI